MPSDVSERRAGNQNVRDYVAESSPDETRAPYLPVNNLDYALVLTLCCPAEA
jgi:hypothetical protein